MTKESKSETLVVMIEPSLKKILKNVADSKKVSLADYTRHVLGVGLDEIHRRNLKIRELEKQLNIK